MRSRNPVYPFLQGAFSIQINGSHNDVSRYNSYFWMEIIEIAGLNREETFSFGAMLSPNIPNIAKARQDLPLPDSRRGTFEPSLYSAIAHAALTLIAYVI